MFRGEPRGKKAERDKKITDKGDPGIYNPADNMHTNHEKTVINQVFGD